MKKVLIVFLAVIFLHINTAAVYATSEYKLLEPLPGFETADSTKFVDYVVSIYSLAIWIAGFCAMSVLVVAGFIYVTSAGNPGRTGKAKDWIVNALSGLMVVFFAWMILNVINPDLTKIDENIKEFVNMGKGGDGGDEPEDDDGNNYDDLLVDSPGEHGGVMNVAATTKSLWKCTGGNTTVEFRGNYINAANFCKGKGKEVIFPAKEVECNNGALVYYADNCGKIK